MKSFLPLVLLAAVVAALCLHGPSTPASAASGAPAAAALYLLVTEFPAPDVAPGYTPAPVLPHPVEKPSRPAASSLELPARAELVRLVRYAPPCAGGVCRVPAAPAAPVAARDCDCVDCVCGSGRHVAALLAARRPVALAAARAATLPVRAFARVAPVRRTMKFFGQVRPVRRFAARVLLGRR